MKKVNLRNLKEIFSKKSSVEIEQEEPEQQWDNPYLNCVLAIRGVSQIELVDELFSNKNPEEYKNVRNAVMIRQFDFIYELLTKIPMQEDKELMEFIIKDVGKTDAIANLSKIINHFAELEEYEKCSEVQKYLLKLEKS